MNPDQRIIPKNLEKMKPVLMCRINSKLSEVERKTGSRECHYTQNHFCESFNISHAAVKILKSQNMPNFATSLPVIFPLQEILEWFLKPYRDQYSEIINTKGVAIKKNT